MSEQEQAVEVGTLWRRNPPFSEVVEVQRVWDYWNGGEEMDTEPTVRAHPVRGGRPLVASVKWLRENFTTAPDQAASDGGKS